MTLKNIKNTFLQSQNHIIFSTSNWNILSDEIKNYIIDNSSEYSLEKDECEFTLKFENYTFVINKKLANNDIYSSTYILEKSNILNYIESYSFINEDGVIQYVSSLRNIIEETSKTSPEEAHLLLKDALAFVIALDKNRILFNICLSDSIIMNKYVLNHRRLFNQDEINKLLTFTKEFKCEILYIDIENKYHNLKDTALTNELLSSIKLLRYLGLFVFGVWYTFNIDKFGFKVDNHQVNSNFLKN